MKTGEFWDYVKRIAETRSGNTKIKVLKEIYIENSPVEVELAYSFIVTNPLEDWDANMGISKKSTRKAIEKAYNVPYNDIREVEKETGSLTETLEQLEPRESLVSEPTETEEGNLRDLDSDLNYLSNMSGETAKINFLADMIETYENPHVILFAFLKRDYKVGASQSRMLKALVKATEYDRSTLDRAYGINPDIGLLAHTLRNGSTPRTNVRLFDRVNPQLASSKNLPDDRDGWMGQYKYDGARILIHHDNESGKIKAFTRNQKEVTENLPELREIDWPDTDFVVDAEAIAVDPDTGEPASYQKAMERFQRERNIEEKRKEVPMEFALFDLLLMGSSDITEHSVKARYDIMCSWFDPDMIAETVIDGNLDELFGEALDKGFEGIIGKDLSAKYQFSRERTWRKVKPVKEPIDVRVYGVVRGTGHMSGTLGALKIEADDGTPLGRVGTGFTDEDRDELWQMHQNGELVGKVVELEFEELQENNGEYGLRFPRYNRLRETGEADTLERIKGL